MNRDQFEPKLLELWMQTRIPLTRAHLQYHTGASRRQLDRWLDELVRDGTLDVDVDDDGAMVWSVPGAARPIDGPGSFADLERRSSMRAEARRKVRRRAGQGDLDDDEAIAGKALLALPKGALSLGGRALGALDRPHVRKDGDKSLLLSAGLSFLGPIGWLYAGSFREAVPATVLALLVAKLIPTFLLFPFLWILMPASAIAGLVYAWQHNRLGHRTTLFLDDPSEPAE